MLGDIASLATAISVFLAAMALLAGGRQRKFQIAQSYIDRYWQLLDRHRDEQKKDPAAADSRLVKTQPLYLDLCEDQYDVAEIGWIEGRTWEFWHDAITAELEHQDIRGHSAGDGCQPGQSAAHEVAGAAPNPPVGYRHLARCLASVETESEEQIASAPPQALTTQAQHSDVQSEPPSTPSVRPGHKAHRCPGIHLSPRTRALWWIDRHLLG